MKFYCINLERRPDRKAQALAQFERANIDVEFIAATDGKKEDPGNLFVTSGEWGSANSHNRIYRDIVKKQHPYAVIFEDDVNLAKDFKSKFNDLMLEVSHIKWDILYLGHYLPINEGKVTDNAFIGKALGIHAYVVSLQGAKKFANFDTIYLDMIWDSVLCRLPILRLFAKNPIAFQSEDGTAIGALLRQIFDGDIKVSKTDWEHHLTYWSTHIMIALLAIISIFLVKSLMR